jgi:hypothetical protein
MSDAVASELRADGRAVKHDGTKRSRTSSAASAARAGTIHNSRDGHRRFFQNPPPPDGPRRSSAPLDTLPAARARVGGSGTLVGGGILCRVRTLDISGPLATATNDAPLGDSLDYSNVIEDEEGRTASHNPSTDKSALG